MKTIYLLNAFSLQMVDVPCTVHFEEVDELPDGLISAIGHADTAHVLSVEPNRINVHLSKGDVARRQVGMAFQTNKQPKNQPNLCLNTS